jgi:rhodanese-related sulfurtransferase
MKSKLMIAILPMLAVVALSSSLDAQCCGGCKAVAKKAVAKKAVAKKAVAKKAVSGGTLDTGALVALMKSRAPMTLIDARSDTQGKTLPGAKTLCNKTLGCSKTLADTLGSRDRLVVTYCSGPKCSASTKMAARLRKAGYENVIEYRHGIAGWTKAMASPSSKAKASGSCPITGKTSGACPSTRKAPSERISSINAPGLKALMNARVPMVLLDARYGKYDDGKRIPGASALKCEGCISNPEFVGNLARSKNDLIVAYCGVSRCPLSSNLAKKLRSAGYENVIVFKDGISSWAKAGFQTVSSEAKSCGGCNGADNDSAARGCCGK